MLIGAHVSAAGGLPKAVERGVEIGAEAIQVFTQSPRAWKPNQYGPEVLAAFRMAMADQDTVTSVVCHATYLINLATPDPVLAERSQACLEANLRVAAGIASDGLVLHIGSHRGSGLEAALDQVVRLLVATLDAVPPAPGDAPCPILLENAAGAGDTVGRTFEELAAVIDAAGGDERLGVCMDTQHLWASGVDYSTKSGLAKMVSSIRATVGMDRLRCVHLNDSAVPLGANRDRHANIGEGTIGAEALGTVVRHRAFAKVPGILEVPGHGDGPADADVVAAKALRARPGRGS